MRKRAGQEKDGNRGEREAGAINEWIREREKNG